jgi:hypothetical protein
MTSSSKAASLAQRPVISLSASASSARLAAKSGQKSHLPSPLAGTPPVPPALATLPQQTTIGAQLAASFQLLFSGAGSPPPPSSAPIPTSSPMNSSSTLIGSTDV